MIVLEGLIEIVYHDCLALAGLDWPPIPANEYIFYCTCKSEYAWSPNLDQARNPGGSWVTKLRTTSRRRVEVERVTVETWVAK